jgi:hypothetical protein
LERLGLLGLLGLLGHRVAAIGSELCCALRLVLVSSTVGLLLDRRTCRMVPLATRSLVGRSAACVAFVEDLRASAEHAVISWTGDHWEVRDLGSLNGTWVDGRRLNAGERVAIARDATLGLGAPDAAWILADDRAAGPAARNELTGELVHASAGLLAVPSPDDPRATVFCNAEGRWTVELRGECSAIEDHARLELDGDGWRLFLPPRLGAVPDTLEDPGEATALAALRLDFAPSKDEEHVDVVVHTGDGRALPLPTRASSYMLLTLARARLDDAAREIAIEDRGWMYASELAEMLQYSPERLNIEIFRVRALFAKLGIVDATRLIERRASTRQLRIGVAELRVTRR